MVNNMMLRRCLMDLSSFPWYAMYETLRLLFYRGLENYLNVKQVTRYISEDQWNWYPSPSKL